MAKHNWILDENGKPDEWAWESGFHNGVICQDCGFRPCVHCDEDWFEMDDCPGPKVRKPQTNADRIRAMTDEELAKVIICPKQVCDKVHILVSRTDCEACSLEWLKQPAEVDA